MPHVILETTYNNGICFRIELKMRDIHGLSPDSLIVKFWSDNGKDFKSNLEGCESNNDTSLFD